MAESEYLLALYILEQRSSPPVSSGHLATFLDRSPAATTEMIQRLEEKDLVTHEAYEGASLTPSGHKQAEALHETYVTLSWFFRAVLDLETYEREAMRMAGLVSPVVTDRLAETLMSSDGVRDGSEITPSDSQ